MNTDTGILIAAIILLGMLVAGIVLMYEAPDEEGGDSMPASRRVIITQPPRSYR